MSGVYVHVKPGRAGLGNMLFPWARAMIFAEAHQMPVLSVQWTQLKIGPLLRRERDKRYYSGLFTTHGYVNGVRKWTALMNKPRIREHDATAIERAISGMRGGVITFEGMDKMFEPLLGHRNVVKRQLMEMLAAPIATAIERDGTGEYIGVHVRRGDTVPLQYGELFPPGPGNRGQPIEWFVKVVKEVRRAMGVEMQARVFSDGTNAQLEPLLQMTGVERAPANPSIVDILLLAKSRVLVTTSNSTFSMWAAYLGNMPTVWYEGKRQPLGEDAPAFEANTKGELGEFFQTVFNSREL